MLKRFFAFLLVGAIVSGVFTFAEIFVLRLMGKKVRCPKCHSVMQRRPAWYHCFACDVYVITDLSAFLSHWFPEVFNAKTDSNLTINDQT